MRQEALSPAEYERLIEALPHLPVSQQVAIGIMLHCGLRAGELLQLQWRDLFFLSELSRCLTVRAETSKSGYSRILPIPSALKLILLNHYLQIKSQGDGVCHPDWPLLPGGRLRPWHDRWLRKMIGKIGQRLLHRRLSPHTLRHTFASRLLKISNIRVVQEALGHRSITSTQIYTHVSQDDLEAAMEIISRRKNGA